MPVEAKAAVANKALTLIGASNITSFEDTTPNARHCALLWSLLIEEAMGAHPWRFAREVVALNVAPGDAATAALYGYDRAFALPTDISHPARTRFYPPSNPKGQIHDYAITQTRLFTNEPAVVMRYVLKEPPPDRWSGDFMAFFVRAFAAMLAGPVGKAKTVGDAYALEAWGLPSEGRRGGLIALALTADAQTEPEESQQTLDDAGPFIAARFGGGSPWRLPS